MEKELIHKSSFECVKFTLFDQEGKNRDVADRLREEFTLELNRKIYHFWIDLTNIGMINSSFIGAIGFMLQKIGEQGTIVVYGSNEQIKNVFDISGLSKLPNIEITEVKTKIDSKNEV